MKRRQFLAASATALALPSVARSEKNSVLKYVPIGDLPTVDPIVSVDSETRNHGFMVFDTLYGQAGAEQGLWQSRKWWPAIPSRTTAGHGS
jgi:peptide/nickel transport system substrate-binding protein